MCKRLTGRGRTPEIAPGFTLIELLVVLAVLCVLAALLFPVFSAVRERGRRTACLSNERQLGMALMQYAYDNGEQFPFGLIANPGTGWAGDCLPYIKDTALFRCPDDGTTAGGRGANEFVVSYALNCNLGGVRYSSPKLGSTSLSAAALSVLSAPTKTVLLFEVSDNITQIGWTTPTMRGSPVDLGSPSGNTATHPGTPDTGDTTFLLGGGGQFQVAEGEIVTRYATGNIGGRILNGGAGSAPRHAGGSDYLACDGHVLWLRPEQVSGGSSAAASDCAQGMEAVQPPDCRTQVRQSAAGTGDGRHVLTFSTR